jgi:hypothetical protein
MFVCEGKCTGYQMRSRRGGFARQDISNRKPMGDADRDVMKDVLIEEAK